jgi:ribosomal protein S27E
MKTYTTQEVINSGINLNPIKCNQCGSIEVTYHQYIGDACCSDCGEWQTEE